MLTIAVFTVNSLLNFIVGLLIHKNYSGPRNMGVSRSRSPAASVVQLVVFEWLRYCVPRFYTRAGQSGGPHVRATLDAAVGWFAVQAAVVALLVYASGLDLVLSTISPRSRSVFRSPTGCSTLRRPCCARASSIGPTPFSSWLRMCSLSR